MSVFNVPDPGFYAVYHDAGGPHLDRARKAPDLPGHCGRRDDHTARRFN